MPPTSEGTDARLPLVNQDAEQGLLGAIFRDNRAYSVVGEFLKPEHFGLEVHGRIFAAISDLIDQNRPANPVTLKLQFDQDPALSGIGAAKYLTQLALSAITLRNSEDYARRIFDLYQRRQLLGLAVDIEAAAYQNDTAATQIQRVETKLSELAGTAPSGYRSKSMGEFVEEALQKAEAARNAGTKLVGLPSGFIDLDGKIGGFEAPDLIVLAGRPAMGKTSIAVQIAEYNALRGYPIGLCELDQSGAQLGQRILAARAGVPTQKLRRGDLDLVQWQRAVDAAGELRSLPLYVDDTPKMTAASVRARARQWHRDYGICMLVVDHLQAMAGAQGGRGDRRLEIDDFLTTLKSIGKELGIPVMVLSQLVRSSEQRDNRRPQLADLRESGAIEQDADIVLFVHREEYYLGREEPARRSNEDETKFNNRHDQWREACERAHGQAEVIIGKQRQGAVGTVRLHWEGEIQRFNNWIGPENLPAGDH